MGTPGHKPKEVVVAGAPQSSPGNSFFSGFAPPRLVSAIWCIPVGEHKICRVTTKSHSLKCWQHLWVPCPPGCAGNHAHSASSMMLGRPRARRGCLLSSQLAASKYHMT